MFSKLTQNYNIINHRIKNKKLPQILRLQFETKKKAEKNTEAYEFLDLPNQEKEC